MAPGNLPEAPTKRVELAIDFTPLLEPPSAPRITDPQDQFSIDGHTVTIAGTADSGTTVELFDWLCCVAKTQTHDDGQWSVTLQDVESGHHVYFAHATRESGASSARSNTIALRAGSVERQSEPTRSRSPRRASPRVHIGRMLQRLRRTATDDSWTRESVIDAEWRRFLADQHPATGSVADRSVSPEPDVPAPLADTVLPSMRPDRAERVPIDSDAEADDPVRSGFASTPGDEGLPTDPVPNSPAGIDAALDSHAPERTIVHAEESEVHDLEASRDPSDARQQTKITDPVSQHLLVSDIDREPEPSPLGHVPYEASSGTEASAGTTSGSEGMTAPFGDSENLPARLLAQPALTTAARWVRPYGTPVAVVVVLAGVMLSLISAHRLGLSIGSASVESIPTSSWVFPPASADSRHVLLTVSNPGSTPALVRLREVSGTVIQTVQVPARSGSELELERAAYAHDVVVEAPGPALPERIVIAPEHVWITRGRPVTHQAGGGRP